MDRAESNPFLDFRWGVERETQRLRGDGRLSGQSHPPTLAGPSFTRDFAESMLEIVTAPRASLGELLAELTELTGRAQRAVAPELLWPFSMPPALAEPSQVAVAALGRRAVLYREGLALRHGKARQMICGVHLNVSFGPAMTAWLHVNAPLGGEEDGFPIRLARNLYQDLPLLTLLFGAAPVAADSPRLVVSHRNGPEGYARAGFLPFLELSSTGAHLEGIRRGLRTLSPAYSALGLVRDGQVLQLNGNVFQTDKEFYAPIRLRQVAQAGESGLQALTRRGVGYLELRFLDVDPFSALGLGEDALRLLHLVILDNLSRTTGARGNAQLGADLARAGAVARMDPLGSLEPALLAELRARLGRLEPWAARLDAAGAGAGYGKALRGYQGQAAQPSRLASARLARWFQGSGKDWTGFGLDIAHQQQKGVTHALDYAGV